MLSACSSTPRLDLSTILSAEPEIEPVPSALLARCPARLPIPPEIERDQEVTPAQLLGIAVSFAGEYHYCRGMNDALVGYIRERQGAPAK